MAALSEAPAQHSLRRTQHEQMLYTQFEVARRLQEHERLESGVQGMQTS
jgi:hypothetical protein